MKKTLFDLEVERPVFQYFILALASTTIIVELPTPICRDSVCIIQEPGLYNQVPQVRILVSGLFSYITLGKVFNLSVIQCFIHEVEMVLIPISQELFLRFSGCDCVYIKFLEQCLAPHSAYSCLLLSVCYLEWAQQDAQPELGTPNVDYPLNLF